MPSTDWGRRPTLYRIAKLTVGAWLLRFFKVKVEGMDRAPLQGPLILAINHLSLLDPLIVGALFPRPVHFMAKRELFQYPVLRHVLRAVLAFPVRRGEADREALQWALRVLSEGGVVGVFPEGTRSQNGRLLDMRGGTAFLSLKSGAPILPVAIMGTDQAMPRGAWWPRRVAVRVVIGAPIAQPRMDSLPLKQRVQKLSRSIGLELARLLNQTFAGEASSSSAC